MDAKQLGNRAPGRSRRAVTAGIAALGVLAVAMACGDGSDPETGTEVSGIGTQVPPGAPPPSPTPTTGSPAPSPAGAGPAPTAGSAPPPVAGTGGAAMPPVAGAGGMSAAGGAAPPPVAGTGGAMEMPIDEAALAEGVATCIAEATAGGDTEVCAECMCGACLLELDACTGDTDPAPGFGATGTEGDVCRAIIECAGRTGCSGDACYCGAPICDITNYRNPGPCKAEIDAGAVFPPPTDADKAPDKPIANSTVVGTCVTANCAAECG